MIMKSDLRPLIGQAFKERNGIENSKVNYVVAWIFCTVQSYNIYANVKYDWCKRRQKTVKGCDFAREHTHVSY